MSVTKTSGSEVYNVKNSGEWATIVVRCWQDEDHPDGRPRHRGELMINSTFGAWSYYWGAPGMPLKRFLIGLGFDYLFGKLMGQALEQYDGEASVTDLRQRVLSMRRRRSIDREVARWIWGEISDRIDTLERSVDGFVDACCSISQHARDWYESRTVGQALTEIDELFDEPWHQTKTRDNPQAVGFWREIWPEFTAALKAEMAEQGEPA
ncbi:hypothetical protein LNV47_22570 [Paucibacter sp. DJ4R-1]|nr:hypothetical protein [Paucibacter sp. DJ4R-1]